jgi:hypothetical protein
MTTADQGTATTLWPPWWGLPDPFPELVRRLAALEAREQRIEALLRDLPGHIGRLEGIQKSLVESLDRRGAEPRGRQERIEALFRSLGDRIGEVNAGQERLFRWLDLRAAEPRGPDPVAEGLYQLFSGCTDPEIADGDLAALGYRARRIVKRAVEKYRIQRLRDLTDDRLSALWGCGETTLAEIGRWRDRLIGNGSPAP